MSQLDVMNGRQLRDLLQTEELPAPPRGLSVPELRKYAEEALDRKDKGLPPVDFDKKPAKKATQPAKKTAKKAAAKLSDAPPALFSDGDGAQGQGKPQPAAPPAKRVPRARKAAPPVAAPTGPDTSPTVPTVDSADLVVLPDEVPQGADLVDSADLVDTAPQPAGPDVATEAGAPDKGHPMAVHKRHKGLCMHRSDCQNRSAWQETERKFIRYCENHVAAENNGLAWQKFA